MSPDPSGVKADEAAYTNEEQHALALADDLRARVGRERETVHRLRAFLVERDDRAT